MLFSDATLKMFDRRLVFVRYAGAFVVVGSSAMICTGLLMLGDPTSTLSINGVPTHAISAKLFFTLASAPHFFIGLLMAICPKSWILRLFTLLEKQKEEQALRLARFDSLFKPT